MRDLHAALLGAAITALAIPFFSGPARLPHRPTLPADLPDLQSPYAELRLNMRPPQQPDPVQQKLDAPLARFDVNRQPLIRALADFAAQAGVDIAVNWPMLQATGLDPASPVSVDLHDLPARTVLRHLLDDHEDLVKLEYRVVDGVIIVSIFEEFAQLKVLRAHDFQDLIERPRDDPDANDGLIMLIQENITPLTFRDGSGYDIWLRIFNDRLVVTGSPKTHEELDRFLTGLRSKSPITVK